MSASSASASSSAASAPWTTRPGDDQRLGGTAATVDPNASVVVLNATTTSGLAAKASTSAKADGWKVVSTANADTQDVKVSTVYYGSKTEQGAALGLAKSLGIGRMARRTASTCPASRGSPSCWGRTSPPPPDRSGLRGPACFRGVTTVLRCVADCACRAPAARADPPRR